MSHDNITFTVRGRPVEFRPSRFFGSLNAVERGYFPVSETGYRSLAGIGPLFTKADEPPIDPREILTPEFLEKLAVDQDVCRRNALRDAERSGRRPPTTRDHIGRFISQEMDADRAFSQGLYAPAQERVALWQAAYRIYNRIDTDASCQPLPRDAGAWDAAQCERSLAQVRLRFTALKALMADAHTSTATCGHCIPTSYFELPARQGGEPIIPIPVISLDFDFAAALTADDQDEEEDADEDGECDEEEDAASDDQDGAGDSADCGQLALFG